MKFDRGWPMKWRVAAVFLGVGSIWGTAWIPAASLSRQLPALIAGVLRFALAAVALGIAAVVLRLRPSAAGRRPTVRLVVPAAVLGVTMLGLPYALTVWTVGRVSPGLVALLFALMPLLVLVSGMEDGETENGETENGETENGGGAIPAVVLGIGGVAMLVAPGLSFRWEQAGGAAALLGAVVSGGFSLAYARRLYARGRLGREDILLFSAIQLAFASVFLLVLSVSTGQETALHWDETAALPLALLAIVVSGGTLPLLYWLLSVVPGWRVATLQWVATWVAAGEGAWIVHARPAPEGWIGAALIPACILWIFRRGGGEDGGPVTLEITSATFQPSKASDMQGESE